MQECPECGELIHNCKCCEMREDQLLYEQDMQNMPLDLPTEEEVNAMAKANGLDKLPF